ncbi:unnamed protein product [Paramecium primaurelia]|uniref:Uncharacterized protein n=1 Tax=Paramecium primaurelia TaxID=5886 RepID=A0A8S1NPZ3_PARPR|nr:unnamed protein product [Paramecium primaurelia]
MFPDNQPKVYGLPINHKSNYFINMWILLEELNFYHVTALDYLSVRSLAFIQMIEIEYQQIDYSHYLLNKRNWENTNLSKLSFKGINTFNWLEERPDKQRDLTLLNRIREIGIIWHLLIQVILKLILLSVVSLINPDHQLVNKISLRYLKRNLLQSNLFKFNKVNRKSPAQPHLGNQSSIRLENILQLLMEN